MLTMFKIYSKRLVFLLWCVIFSGLGLGTLAYFQTPSAFAAEADASIEITHPLVNGMAVGHVGTKVTIRGEGFESNSNVELYTTKDSSNCTDEGDPSSHNLAEFKTNSSVNTSDDGSFTIETTWPDNASTVATAYYICGISNNSSGVSSNSFTVAESVNTNVTPTSVSPGDEVTVAGINWLPPQALTVSVVGSTGTALVSQQVNPNANGTFSTRLTIPENAAEGTYSVTVQANNETNMKDTKSNVLSVSQSVTPTPEVTPTATATQAATPTATPTPSNSGPTGMTFFAYGLGGLGIMMVIIGIIMYVVYSRP